MTDYVDLRRQPGDLEPDEERSLARWKHLASPLGPSTYVRLVAGGKTVGCALLQPRNLHTNSDTLKTACVTDVVIDRAYRAPPSNFVNLTMASTEVDGVTAVYHTSNRTTDALYAKLMRFPRPFSLVPYGLPVHVDGMLGRWLPWGLENPVDALFAPFRYAAGWLSALFCRLSGVVVSARMPDDRCIRRIFARQLETSGPMLGRDSAFLKWRLLDSPALRATVCCVERRRECVGYVATRILEIRRMRCLVVVDFLLDPGLTMLERLAVRMWLVSRAITSKVQAVATLVNPMSEAARVCVGLPFVRVPEVFLPHGTPIFFRAACDDGRFLETEGTTHLTLADLDYI